MLCRDKQGPLWGMLIQPMYATSGFASLSGSEGRPIEGSRCSGPTASRRGFNLSGDLGALYSHLHTSIFTRRRSSLPQASLCCCVESSAIMWEDTWVRLQWRGGSAEYLFPLFTSCCVTPPFDTAGPRA